VWGNGTVTVTINGGEISGNSANKGGGVHVMGGTVTMNSGIISGNSAMYGGGVYVDSSNSSRFAKTGGTIYGYDKNDPDSNKVVNASGAIQNNSGHAGYVYNGTYRKETTVGPHDDLIYRYPTDSDISGWN
jgi:hypothetical protein